MGGSLASSVKIGIADSEWFFRHGARRVANRGWDQSDVTDRKKKFPCSVELNRKVRNRGSTGEKKIRKWKKRKERGEKEKNRSNKGMKKTEKQKRNNLRNCFSTTILARFIEP